MFSQKITILNAENNALYDKNYGVLITPNLIFSSVLAHEMVHSFHIGHSYSDRNVKVSIISSTTMHTLKESKVTSKIRILDLN